MPLASDASWDVFSSDPTIPGAVFLGKAQPVCLNATTPANCPAGALLYGNPATAAWTADLSTLPGAVWVWVPGVTGATTTADLAQAFFTKTITLPAAPLSASISVAADDFAQVLVNGFVVGIAGSAIDPAAAAAAGAGLTTFDITSQLVPGDNRIVVQGVNGPASFASCGGAPCSYQQNPAGVVFGGVISFDRPPLCDRAFADPSVAWPPNHKPVTVAMDGVTDPDGDPVAITIDAIRQDEPADGSCSGAGGIGTDRATVLVERDGQGDGRVYHILFHASDPFGGACTGDVTLCVPHDQGHGGGCGDGGPLFDSVGSCGVPPPPVQCIGCDDEDPVPSIPAPRPDALTRPCHVPTASPVRSTPAWPGFASIYPQPVSTPAGVSSTNCHNRSRAAVHSWRAGSRPPSRTPPSSLTGRPGTPTACRPPMVRRALHRLAKASRLLTRARHKGVAPACVEEVASRIRGARASARAWLAGD